MPGGRVWTTGPREQLRPSPESNTRTTSVLAAKLKGQSLEKTPLSPSNPERHRWDGVLCPMVVE